MDPQIILHLIFFNLIITQYAYASNFYRNNWNFSEQKLPD